MKEELQNIKTELDDIKNKIENNNANISKNRENISQNTGAIEVLHTIKTYNTRFFIMWIITFIAFIGLLSYTFYLLNDMQRITTTQEIEDVDTIGGNVTNGDIYG